MTVTLDQYEQAELFHWIGFRHAQADIHARQAHIEARAREATRI